MLGEALAARRLGANVSLVACVGTDANAEEALALFQLPRMLGETEEGEEVRLSLDGRLRVLR